MGAATGAAGLGYFVSSADNAVHVDLFDPLPTRKELLGRLAKAGKDNPFDVLIIGGGATGTGCALDAATRCADCPRPSTPIRIYRDGTQLERARAGLFPGAGGRMSEDGQALLACQGAHARPARHALGVGCQA